MWKQLKNRYNDVNKHKRFVTGIDRSKMRLFDVSDAEQTLVGEKPEEDKPLFDSTEFGKRDIPDFNHLKV